MCDELKINSSHNKHLIVNTLNADVTSDEFFKNFLFKVSFPKIG